MTTTTIYPIPGRRLRAGLLGGCRTSGTGYNGRRSYGTRGAGIDRVGHSAQAHLATVQRLHGVEEWAPRTREPVELPDDERIVGAQVVERRVQSTGHAGRHWLSP